MDSDTKKSAEAQEQIRTAARNTAQRAATSVEQTGSTASEALRRAGDTSAEIARRDADAGAEAMRHLTEAAAETARKGTRVMAEGQQELLQTMAGQFEEAARKMSQAVQGTAEDMRSFMTLPMVNGRGLQEFQQGLGALAEGTIRTNLRAGTELFRLANPTAAIELQQRFAREWLDNFLQSSAALMRATRQVAEQTLGPLEKQIEQRRQGNGGSHSQRVADAMTRDVLVVKSEDTVQHAVGLMRESDAGAMPVAEGDRLVGMVTDRDIAVRVVAEARDPAATKVRDVMTREVRYVFEDEGLDHVVDNMTEQQVRRLPVMNRDKRLVGILSLGDLAERAEPQLAGRALHGVSRNGGRHMQAAE